MNPTEAKLDEVLNGLGDDLQPVNQDPPKDEPTTPPADSQDPPADDKPEAQEDEPKPGDVVEPEKKEDESSEGFTADDLIKDEPEETEPESKEPEVQELPKNLDPELQYIVENLPDITTRIMDGDQVKEVSVKSYTQLPDDVQFASKRDELAFLNAMNAQESRARELQSQFRNNQQERQTQEFQERENNAIRDDITTLQKEGLLPKFQVSPDDPKFQDDPGTKEVQRVLDFMNKKNQEYLERYNNGSAYRHIGFEEAYYMMPETQQKAAQRVAQKTEDQARKTKAGQVSGNTGTAPLEMPKPTFKRGTTLDQIADFVDQTW